MAKKQTKQRDEATSYSVRFNKQDWEKVKELMDFFGLKTIAPIIRMGVKELYNKKIKNNKKGGKK